MNRMPHSVGLGFPSVMPIRFSGAAMTRASTMRFFVGGENESRHNNSGQIMKTRDQAREFAEEQLDCKTPGSDFKSAWHYGKCEIEELLDFIYGTDTVSSMKNANLS